MLLKLSLVLYIATLLQGDADSSAVTDPGNGKGGLASVLKVLTGLQADNDQLRQALQQSTSQLMGLVRALQKDNTQLWQQFNDSQTTVASIMSDMGNDMWDNLQQVQEQVQSQMSGLVKLVEQVKNQREETGVTDGELDTVQQVEKENLTSLLSHLAGRMTSAEASLLKLQVGGSGCPEQLATIQHKVDSLESSMKILLHKPANKMPSAAAPYPTTWLSVPSLIRHSVPKTMLPNVALNKPAVQSTYHPSYGNPERAVDGFKGTNIAQCTHTAAEDNNPNRWWRVDLMGQFEVHAVVITNRGDCCGFRLRNFSIYVKSTLSDPLERKHDPSDLCVHHSGFIRQGATVHLKCSQPVTGQYVSLVLPTDSEPLNFCEMEVLGKAASEDVRKATNATFASTRSSVLTNVALNKPAVQSTYHPSYGNPEKVVDGVPDTMIRQCTHTADEDNNPNRWWRVDLMGQFEVHAVVITNRGDCCGYRLANFSIYVMPILSDPSESKHDPSDLCVYHSGEIRQGATVRLQCDQPITGQYVSLMLPTDSQPLNFCEMEVLGKPAPGGEDELDGN